MKRWLKPIRELLALLALGSLALVLATAFRAWPPVSPPPQLAQAPVANATPQAYPGLLTPTPFSTLRPGQPSFTASPRAYPPRKVPSPYPTRPPETHVKPTGFTFTAVPEARTYPPKSTLIPSITPSATPIPTALPLPSSAYHALWIENAGEGPFDWTASIWLADPRDVSSRQRVIELAQQRIWHIAPSPDGKCIAFSAMPWKGQTSLWLAGMDGSESRQLAPVGFEPLWIPDGHAIVYATGGEAVEGTAIDILDLQNGTSRHLVPPMPHIVLNVLGWHTPGRELCYAAIDLSLEDRDDQVWTVDIDGGAPQKVASSGTSMISLQLSPDGTKVLYAGESIPGPYLLELATGAISSVQPGGYGCAIWGPQGQRLVSLVQIDSVVALRSYDQIAGRHEDVMLPSAPRGQWGLVSMSPDGHWLSAYGPHGILASWIHVPSGLVVPMPSGDPACVWIPAQP